MTYANTQKFYFPPIANYPTYCHIQRVCHLGFLYYKIVAFFKDSLSYSPNRGTLLLDCCVCCEVALSWYQTYCNCSWTGCQGQPLQAQSSKRAEQGLLPQRAKENGNRANYLQLQKSLWLSQVFILDPVWYFHLTAPFLTGSSSALTQLQEVWGLWPQVLHIPLLMDPETEPLGPGRTGSSKLGAQHFPSYLLLSSHKWYRIWLGQIERYNACGSLR